MSAFSLFITIPRREALNMWKSKLGKAATYRALVEVFYKAGRLDYADHVCSLLRDESATPCKRCSGMFYFTEIVGKRH